MQVSFEPCIITGVLWSTGHPEGQFVWGNADSVAVQLSHGAEASASGAGLPLFTDLVPMLEICFGSQIILCFFVAQKQLISSTVGCWTESICFRAYAV